MEQRTVTRPTAEAHSAALDTPLLAITTDGGGAIAAIDGTWLGERVLHAGHLIDIIHPDDHDAVERLLAWLEATGVAAHAVNTHVRGSGGWSPAVMTVTATDQGLLWHVVPVLPDPLPATVEAVTAGRDLASSLEEALACFADVGDSVWASIHYGRGDEDRYTAVVATTGRDTFRRAIETATAGERACPWDVELGGDGDRVDFSAFGDGIRLAAPRAGLTACDLVPVQVAGDGDIGCLVVWAETTEQLDSPDLQALCDRVMTALALAFRIDTARSEARQLATIDQLTGLLNRQAFLTELQLPAARRRCAMACIDVDGFRTVNTHHGNAVGDEILAQLARRLRQVMRPGDVVARVSGDEFALLCFDVASEETAEQIASRLIEVCDQPYQVRTGSIHINVSVGMALSSPDHTGGQLFEAAQRDMLDAKHDGRPGWSPA